MVRVGSLEFDGPAVMGVLNVTPDSFSDGGNFVSVDAARKRADTMVAAGASIIDVGGESTRPGAEPVSADAEIDRVIPVIEAIRTQLDTTISIDTSKPQVMRAAIEAGADIINDVNALRADGALKTAAELGKPVVLMHMLGDPGSMQDNPRYDDVVAEVTAFLQARVAQCREAGLDHSLVIVDPGFGFGKTPEHNLELLANLGQLRHIGCPILIGVSRKSTLGTITGRGVEGRLAASLAAAVLAVAQGASIVRAHDIAATVDALRVTNAVMEADREL